MTRTDTERLEWMANMSYHFENYGPRDDDPRCLMDQCGNRIGRKGTDIRKMIDSAMNAESPCQPQPRLQYGGVFYGER